MIGGFIISGNVEKNIVIRALGPSLVDFGVRRPLADPVLELYDSTGAQIGQNDNWTSLPPGTIPAELEPSNTAESVIAAALPPGSYTAVLRGVDNSSGNALCELYNLVPGDSDVRNISTRGLVGTDDDVMIGGLIVGGSESSEVLIRALGPSLNAFGVKGALQDPVLELHNGDGSLIFKNDNWRADQEQQIVDSGIPPTNEKESAILASLPPGNYTAVVRGAANSTGVALVEVYKMDSSP